MSTATIRLRELTVRYTVRRDLSGQCIHAQRQILQPRDSAEILMALLDGEPSEVFGILCLSTRFRLLAYHEVVRGTLDSVVVSPREVFRAALLTNAKAIILAHVHPSGDPSPSHDDVALTARLIEGGRLLDIDVLDHIIVGDNRYASLKEMGRM